MVILLARKSLNSFLNSGNFTDHLVQLLILYADRRHITHWPHPTHHVFVGPASLEGFFHIFYILTEENNQNNISRHMKIIWSSNFSDYLKSFSGIQSLSFDNITYAAFALRRHSHHLQTGRKLLRYLLTIWFSSEKVC